MDSPGQDIEQQYMETIEQQRMRGERQGDQAALTVGAAAK